MSKRDELIEKYAADIKDKFGETPNMDLLTKVTIGLGPSIYNMDASKVSGSGALSPENVTFRPFFKGFISSTLVPNQMFLYCFLIVLCKGLTKSASQPGII